MALQYILFTTFLMMYKAISDHAINLDNCSDIGVGNTIFRVDENVGNYIM